MAFVYDNFIVLFAKFNSQKKEAFKFTIVESCTLRQMNPIALVFLISLLAKARTRREKLKLAMLIMTVLSQQQGHTNLRRMARSTSSDDLVVHLLACLREEPTGVHEPFNSDIFRKILRGNERQFRPDVSSITPCL